MKKRKRMRASEIRDDYTLHENSRPREKERGGNVTGREHLMIPAREKGWKHGGAEGRRRGGGVREKTASVYRSTG